MPILDARTKFCEEEDLSAAAGTALLGDVIDLTTARDIGNGQPLYLNVAWTTALDSASDTGTVTLLLASDAAAAIATDGSATEHIRSEVLGVGAATAVGKAYSFPLPAQGTAYERYLGILVTTATQTTTAGAITAWLSVDPAPDWIAYPEAVS